MPIVGQIQPSYLHPHVATYINDNTEFTDEAAAVADDSIKLFYVITSQKGRDNVFLTHTDQYEWLKEYGNPNINLYGQAGYMAHASLSTGVCTVKTMRVMPEDATYANALIALKVKVDETDGKKLIVKHTCSFRDDVSDKGDILAGLETLRDEEPDESGFITLPLAAIYCVGRGTYGNEFRVRIAQSLQMDRENDYKNCKVEILGTENGISSLGFFEGAIYDGALDGKRSIYIEDYVNDITTGSGHINMYIEPTTLDKFTEMYAEINPEANIKTIDVFGFLTKEAKELTGIEVDAETVILDGVEGIPLSGGSNGSFDNADATVRQAKINEVLVKAMKGEIDKSIKSRRRVPADVMLDCCYDAEVKRAMLDLANTRNSATFYMDAGKLTTTAQAIDWADEMKNLSPYLLSKNHTAQLQYQLLTSLQLQFQCTSKIKVDMFHLQVQMLNLQVISKVLYYQLLIQMILNLKKNFTLNVLTSLKQYLKQYINVVAKQLHNLNGLTLVKNIMSMNFMTFNVLLKTMLQQEFTTLQKLKIAIDSLKMLKRYSQTVLVLT